MSGGFNDNSSKTITILQAASSASLPTGGMETENKTTILVTGGAGFIGSHLCERLLQMGYHVVCLDNFNDSYTPSIKRSNIHSALLHPNYRLVEGDILDTCLVEKVMAQHHIEVIIHLAALAGVRNSIQTPLNYIEVDIKGTVVLLEAGRKFGIKKFIFASSSSVYGAGTTPFLEGNPPCFQVSPYAAAKYSGELFCSMYHHLYGIPTVCLRFFTVYGPRQRPDMAVTLFTKAMEEGQEICIYGDGKSSRDYTYIDDIVKGIIKSIGLQCNFEAINLGSSAAVGILELVRTIENSLGKKANLRFIMDQPGDVPATFADTSKAKALLGFEPKVKLDEGIRCFTQWYRNRNKPLNHSGFT